MKPQPCRCPVFHFPHKRGLGCADYVCAECGEPCESEAVTEYDPDAGRTLDYAQSHCCGAAMEEYD